MTEREEGPQWKVSPIPGEEELLSIKPGTPEWEIFKLLIRVKFEERERCAKIVHDTRIIGGETPGPL